MVCVVGPGGCTVVCPVLVCSVSVPEGYIGHVTGHSGANLLRMPAQLLLGAECAGLILRASVCPASESRLFNWFLWPHKVDRAPCLVKECTNRLLPSGDGTYVGPPGCFPE